VPISQAFGWMPPNKFLTVPMWSLLVLGKQPDERGQMSLMIVGFMIVVMLAIAAVTDASAAYLQHSDLDTVSDGAALTAADTLDEEFGSAKGLSDNPRLTREVIDQRISEYLRETGAYQRFPGLQWSSEIRDDEVIVEVQAPLDLPLKIPGSASAAVITSTGAASLVSMR
jgi:hypothetical protein